jgi:prepilin-type N-terminal cleavage/methylation domain-containing protein
MLFSKRTFKKGFTLVELLVTITIFVILTGVVLFNQQKFNSTILLTNLAYDTALNIRQAQTYGINIKEFGTGQFVPYGVHFAMSNPTSFILFADIASTPRNVFNGTTLDRCVSAEGCVSRYNITRGNYIVDICTEPVPAGTFTCGNSKNSVDIVFKRPNPDALITFEGMGSPQSAVTIILGNPDGSTRKVVVRSNGLIEIVN